MATEPIIIVGGGQSGLAAAHALRQSGLRPVLLEASDHADGSWPHYYDSLTLFSPARFSSLPGLEFPGEAEHYPHRDEVVDYLRRYAAGLDVEIRTGTRVMAVTHGDGAPFLVHTADGQQLPAAGVVAATGSFGNPHRPDLPGQHTFEGRVLHVADYRSPDPFAGQRVVVVGAGNSAVQVGYELAAVASVTLATRAPIRFLPQQVQGHDIHHWFRETGFDHLPASWLAGTVSGTPVLDTGVYRRAVAEGQFDRRPMFHRLDGSAVVWSDGAREQVDTILLATGYRPHLDYLGDLGALDPAGAPLHDGGISTTCPGLVYVGLEMQRSFASNTLRGVYRDARHVAGPLAAHAGKAPVAVGL